ncbi:MAG: hypothetical protein KatS3mg038_1037 [Candidatus Kapaibacterium sp.]|nr:MAG: hypothetical protein KatS3mg038_1037 [Candidatus Kapabacteria bacterium]
MSLLTTAQAVKEQLSIASHTDDHLIERLVRDASAMIETHCGRIFGTLIGTLQYDRRPTLIGGRIDGRILYFDRDVLKIDVLINGVYGTLDSQSYRLLPTNPPITSRATLFPRYAVELLTPPVLPWGLSSSGSQGAITIIGTFGYCLPHEVPYDVQLAATRLAAWLYQNRDNDGSSVQAPDGTLTIPAEAPSFVLKTLQRYVRVNFVG